MMDKPFKIVNGDVVLLSDAEVAEREALVESDRIRIFRDSKIYSIQAKEASITPRRLRDALLTDAGKLWLEAVEAEIAQLRIELAGVQ